MEPRPLVLVTDDDADTREMYRLGLGLSGISVELASDGEEALEKTRRLLPDVVVTDIALPRMDGFDLCRHIKATSATAHIPVIALTGWSGKSFDEKIVDAGFDGTLMKPVAPELLVSAVEVLAKSAATREDSRALLAKATRLHEESRRLEEKSRFLRAKLQKAKE